MSTLPQCRADGTGEYSFAPAALPWDRTKIRQPWPPVHYAAIASGFMLNPPRLSLYSFWNKLEHQMARPVEATPTIIGDVAVETISLNDKGGSLAAVLKRSIRGQLKQGEPGFGAKLEFAPGVSAVFLAPSTFEEDEVGNKGQVLNILHISPGRYIIELEGLSKEEVDPVTKATLTIIEQMLREGKVGVVPADQFEQRIADAKRDGAELVTELKRKRRGPAMK